MPPAARSLSKFASIAAAFAAFALAVACGAKPEPTPAEGDAGAAPTAPPPAAIEPFTYPPPVAGHLKEANVGDFDLVDGVAFPARDRAKGTVVFVTAKPIASPAFADSACAASQARALKVLRNSPYAEVTLDAEGRSPSFVYGTPYAGTGRGIEVGGREWPATIAVEGGRAKGSVKHRHYGQWTFDLPVSPTAPGEVSEDDRMEAGYASWGTGATPTEAEATTAYGLTYRAVMDGDLAKYLELQGFTPEQSAKIRGLAGIDEDFAAHRDRFLDPGAPEEPTLAAGFAAVGARGKNSKGEAFANYYEFTPCGDRFILTSIALNPQ
jgi:hypothetical protein